jgi:hypothetical protein
VQALEQAQRDDDVPMTIGATYRDADGVIVHVAQPVPVVIGGKVDYRTGIWEARQP